MNNTRRKQINSIVEQLESLKTELETILEQEQEYFDNIPESLQDGERAAMSDEAIENLGISIDSLDECIVAAQEATHE